MAHIDRLLELIDNITGQWGKQLYDHERGENCDIGQAICRELYGPNWMKSPQFHADEEKGENDKMWVSDEMVTTAEKMLVELPEWTRKAQSGEEEA